MLENKELRNKVYLIMGEIVDIARKKGINLPENIIETSLKKAEGFPYVTKISFQRDFEQMDKADERTIYGDTIISLGKNYGVLTPVTSMVNKKLHEPKPVLPKT